MKSEDHEKSPCLFRKHAGVSSCPESCCFCHNSAISSFCFAFLLSIVNLNPLEANHTRLCECFPLLLSCLSACNYHSLVSAPNPLSPYKAKCFAADVPQISGIPPHHHHSDGQRLIFVACNDLVPWTLLTCDQTESLPLNIAASYKQWYSDEQLQKKMSGPVSVHMIGWWNMIPSSHFPSISPWRWIRKTKVKDEEQGRERERERTPVRGLFTQEIVRVEFQRKEKRQKKKKDNETV